MTSLNFRDVGLWINEIVGEQVLPEGRLLRGGKLDDIASLEEIGSPKSILNIRRGADLKRFDVTYYHYPLPKTYDRYETQNKEVRKWLNEVVSLFEQESLEYPVFIHCTSGKDRTGVLVAALLKVIGVSDEAIAEEYDLSEEVDKQAIQRSLEGIGDTREYFNRVADLNSVVRNLTQISLR